MSESTLYGICRSIDLTACGQGTSAKHTRGRNARPRVESNDTFRVPPPNQTRIEGLKPDVLILIGPPCAGKTTLGRRLQSLFNGTAVTLEFVPVGEILRHYERLSTGACVAPHEPLRDLGASAAASGRTVELDGPQNDTPNPSRCTGTAPTGAEILKMHINSFFAQLDADNQTSGATGSGSGCERTKSESKATDAAEGGGSRAASRLLVIDGVKSESDARDVAEQLMGIRSRSSEGGNSPSVMTIYIAGGTYAKLRKRNTVRTAQGSRGDTTAQFEARMRKWEANAAGIMEVLRVCGALYSMRGSAVVACPICNKPECWSTTGKCDRPQRDTAYSGDMLHTALCAATTRKKFDKAWFRTPGSDEFAPATLRLVVNATAADRILTLCSTFVFGEVFVQNIAQPTQNKADSVDSDACCGSDAASQDNSANSRNHPRRTVRPSLPSTMLQLPPQGEPLAVGNIPADNFCVARKCDGVRYMAVIVDEDETTSTTSAATEGTRLRRRAYLINRREFVFEAPLVGPGIPSNTVMDGELVRSQDARLVFVAFDVLCAGGERVWTRTLNDRMEVLRSFSLPLCTATPAIPVAVADISGMRNGHGHRDVGPGDDLAFDEQQIAIPIVFRDQKTVTEETVREELTSSWIPSDGLIFTPRQACYAFDRDPLTLKWVPVSALSIDITHAHVEENFRLASRQLVTQGFLSHKGPKYYPGLLVTLKKGLRELCVRSDKRTANSAEVIAEVIGTHERAVTGWKRYLNEQIAPKSKKTPTTPTDTARACGALAVRAQSLTATGASNRFLESPIAMAAPASVLSGVGSCGAGTSDTTTDVTRHGSHPARSFHPAKVADALEAASSQGIIQASVVKRDGDTKHLCVYNYRRGRNLDLAMETMDSSNASGSISAPIDTAVLLSIARGIVVNVADKTVVATPFVQFDAAEVREVASAGRAVYEVSSGDAAEATVKIDGTMGTLFLWEGQPLVATRRRFDSEQAIWATAWARAHIPAAGLEAGWTYLCEIIYDNNVHVVKYPYEGLVLLAVFGPDGTESSRDGLVSIAKRLQVPVPTMLHGPFQDLRAATMRMCDMSHRRSKSVREVIPTVEGWVVRRCSDGKRHKVRDGLYEECAAAIAGVTPLEIWRGIYDGRISLDATETASHGSVVLAGLRVSAHHVAEVRGLAHAIDIHVRRIFKSIVERETGCARHAKMRAYLSDTFGEHAEAMYDKIEAEVDAELAAVRTGATSGTGDPKATAKAKEARIKEAQDHLVQMDAFLKSQTFPPAVTSTFEPLGRLSLDKRLRCMALQCVKPHHNATHYPGYSPSASFAQTFVKGWASRRRSSVQDGICGLLNLPPELVHEIASRLPAHSLAIFASTCHAVRAVVAESKLLRARVRSAQKALIVARIRTQQAQQARQEAIARRRHVGSDMDDDNVYNFWGERYEEESENDNDWY